MTIGITGTLGAGKGTIVDILKEFAFEHYSARNFIVEEIKKRGLKINRDSMTLVSNDLRENFGSAYITDQLYLQSVQKSKNSVIESIRAIGEIDSLRKNSDFLLWAIDADVKLRYERIISRKSATDMISFEKFLSDEEREMSSTDPNHQNLFECIKRADHVFLNNGNIDELRGKIVKELEKLKPENVR
jgi:dephospho-CoA kinase